MRQDAHWVVRDHIIEEQHVDVDGAGAEAQGGVRAAHAAEKGLYAEEALHELHGGDIPADAQHEDAVQKPGLIRVTLRLGTVDGRKGRHHGSRQAAQYVQSGKKAVRGIRRIGSEADVHSMNGFHAGLYSKPGRFCKAREQAGGRFPPARLQICHASPLRKKPSAEAREEFHPAG